MVQIDIEMPHDCEDCPLLYDSLWCKVTGDDVKFDKDGYYVNTRLPNCPLKEIDKDKSLEEIKTYLLLLHMNLIEKHREDNDESRVVRKIYNNIFGTSKESPND